MFSFVVTVIDHIIETGNTSLLKREDSMGLLRSLLGVAPALAIVLIIVPIDHNDPSILRDNLTLVRHRRALRPSIAEMEINRCCPNSDDHLIRFIPKNPLPSPQLGRLSWRKVMATSTSNSPA